MLIDEIFLNVKYYAFYSLFFVGLVMRGSLHPQTRICSAIYAFRVFFHVQSHISSKYRLVAFCEKAFQLFYSILVGGFITSPMQCYYKQPTYCLLVLAAAYKNFNENDFYHSLLDMHVRVHVHIPAVRSYHPVIFTSNCRDYLEIQMTHPNRCVIFSTQTAQVFQQ